MNIRKIIEEEINKFLAEKEAAAAPPIPVRGDSEDQGTLQNPFPNYTALSTKEDEGPEALKGKSFVYKNENEWRVSVYDKDGLYLNTYLYKGRDGEDNNIWSVIHATDRQNSGAKKVGEEEVAVNLLPGGGVEPAAAEPAAAPARPRPVRKPRQKVKELQTLLNQVLSAKKLPTLKPQPGAKDGVDGIYGIDTRRKVLQLIPEPELKPLTIAQIIEKLKGMLSPTPSEATPAATPAAASTRGIDFGDLLPQVRQPLTKIWTDSRIDPEDLPKAVIKQDNKWIMQGLQPSQSLDIPSQYWGALESIASGRGRVVQESKSLRGMILKEILAALK